MKKVALDEIMGLERYERERVAFRQRIIDLKKQRRVAVGDRITFVFENHETALFQIQEMVRAEHIVDLDRVRAEVDVYNTLVPDPGELSATMLIELTEAERIREELVRLIGIDTTVSLRVGARHVIPAEFEPGRTQADKLSAVQYVRFAFDPAARAAFLDDTQVVRLVIDHPNYRHEAIIDGAIRAALVQDLDLA